MQSTLFDGKQVEPMSEKPKLSDEPLSSCKRLGADVRIAHQGPMSTNTASFMRPDTRRQSTLHARDKVLANEEKSIHDQLSAEISQISNAPGLDGDAYSCSDIWRSNENRC